MKTLDHPTVPLGEAASSFLNADIQKMRIGGEWRAAASGKTFADLDPGSGETIATVAAGDAADVDSAVAAAEEAFHIGPWATLSIDERSTLLERLADVIDAHTETLAEIESLDVGKPRAQAAGFDIPHAAETFRYYARLSRETPRSRPLEVEGFDAHTIRKPYGVCGFIFPWNFPFLLIGWGIAPALAAGNTVVIKPAEDTPLSTLYFARLAEEAGIPKGVINVVTGLGETAGAALAGHPDIKRMSFTGSPEVGKLVAEACGRNLTPVKLELGGKGAALVFDDVDVAATARALAEAVTLNAGQVCCTATRWIVHESVFDEFVKHAADTMRALRIGHGAEESTALGPVVSAKQRDRILNYLNQGIEHGASYLLEGGPAEVADHPDGFYVKPALLTGPADNPCATDEIFGPVSYLMKFSSEDEAVDLVHRSTYGLANSVWTGDGERLVRVGERLTAGNSWLNAHNVFAQGIPYGGCNLSGCGGGVLGPDTFDDYLRNQSVVRPLG